ncbi:MAG TPA: hypothetical protein VE957_11970 [Terriglobales bacterium]|nr:hypothetical protein [Terriglobales bacterium]
MNRRLWGIFAAVCTLAMMAAWTAPARAQDEPKEKPPMYSYVSFWNIPRPQWAEMGKADASDQKILEKAMADGTIIGYGNDTNLVHQPDGGTHDDWWSAMSMAGLLNVLDKFYKSGSTTSPVLASATKHWDNIFVSRYYNWHSGSFKGAYTRAAQYKLKPDAPNDAVETLSKHLFVPLLEKLLADGAILEYEVDTEAIHTEDPGTFWVIFVATNADGLDKFNAAVRDMHKMNPLGGPAIGSMVDFTPHRDYLSSSTGTYK